MTPTGEFMIPGQYTKRLQDEHEARYAFAAQYIKNQTVLDIACGTGYGCAILSTAGAVRVDGVDVSEEAINYAKKHYTSDRVSFTVGSILDYISDVQYDVITSFETIEHVDDYKAALANLKRLLRTSGTLIISTPNRPMSWRPGKSIEDKPFNPYHVREFDLEEFKTIVRESGFEFTEHQIYGQRSHLKIDNRYIRKLYHIIFKPYDRSSPKVQPLTHLPPKYIVIVAKKSST